VSFPLVGNLSSKKDAGQADPYFIDALKGAAAAVLLTK
jgi:hypothetical protein